LSFKVRVGSHADKVRKLYRPDQQDQASTRAGKSLRVDLRKEAEYKAKIETQVASRYSFSQAKQKKVLLFLYGGEATVSLKRFPSCLNRDTLGSLADAYR
jgi:hypothetical protein